MIVSGLTEADIASQIPQGRADDPSRRQTELNVSIIRPMKKILTTLTVIAATALGAQGQTTNTFPAGAGPNSFTGMTFNTFSGNLPANENYTQAQLLFGVTGATNFRLPSRGILIEGITLSGQGITGSLALADTAIFANSTAGNANTYVSTEPINLSTPIVTWSSATNVANFTVSTFGGAGIPVGARLYYAVQYTSANGGQLNTAFQNIDLVAVPEPSTYFAAAGLLGLCLWSARRQLFKLAGLRCTPSSSGSNGAA